MTIPGVAPLLKIAQKTVYVLAQREISPVSRLAAGGSSAARPSTRVRRRSFHRFPTLATQRALHVWPATCNGRAYTFQVPGPLTVQENVVILMKVQDAASIRCISAYFPQGTTGGQSAYLDKISRDGGATWEPLQYMGIAQALPDAYKTTYDFLVTYEGCGLPATRRLPYADYGLVLIAAVIAGPDPQTLQTASYGANRLGLVTGGFVFLAPGGANEEYVRVLSVDPENQSFQAIVTKNLAAGERIRPTIWPSPTLNEGDDLAFDILAVATPDPASDLTVVIQT